MYYQNIKKKIILILILHFLFIQPTIAEELNFNDFLATALYNSYNLKISKIEHEISNKGIKEADYVQQANFQILTLLKVK